MIALTFVVLTEFLAIIYPNCIALTERVDLKYLKSKAHETKW